MTLFSGVRFSLPPLGDFSSAPRPPGSNSFPPRTPPPETAEAPPSRGPGLPAPHPHPTACPAPRRAEKRCEVSPLLAGPGGGADPGRQPRRERGPAEGPPPAPRRRPPPRPAARPPAPPGPLPARPRALPAERRGACCFLLGMLLGPPQPSPQPPPEFAGRGDAGPRARAQLRGAPNFGLVPAGSGLRARRGPRGAARMDGRARGRSGGGGGGRAGRVPAAGLRAERAGPRRRVPSHPRRGPRAQRRALGGPARGPRSMPPPPAAALLPAGAPLRLPPRAESLRAQLSLPLAPRCSGVAACDFSARVAAFSLCASEADPGCPFPPRT